MKLDSHDVVVVGGGPGGFGAAVAAARSGAKTLLIEREGCLGGGATTMLVNPFMPYTTDVWQASGPHKLVNGGLFTEVRRRLVARKAVNPADDRRFDDEALKVILDEIATESGVEIIFHAAMFDAQAAGGRVQSVRLAHNSGPMTAGGKVFVDATGDALLAQQAGCRIMLGDAEGKVMPMTLNFMVAGVDTANMPSGREIVAMAADGGKDTPALVNTNVNCISMPRVGVVHFNAIRISGSTLDAADLSRAEIEGRRRVENFVAWLRARIPAFANCWLCKTANHIGIRESRRVVGDYVLTGDDWKRCARFDDAIACSSYPVDIHGNQPGMTDLRFLPEGEYYQVPYRCLTPAGAANLLMASRSISADVVAHASLRTIPTVMNIGEAAGYAAAMSLAGGDVRSIDVRKLQDRIRLFGGILEPK